MNQIHHQAKWDSHVPGPWATCYWIKEPHRFNKQPLVTSIHNGQPNLAVKDGKFKWRNRNIKDSVAPSWMVRMGYSSKLNWTRRFRCADNNANFLCAQTRYYSLRNVDTYHQLERRSQALFLSNGVVGFISKQRR